MDDPGLSGLSILVVGFVAQAFPASTGLSMEALWVQLAILLLALLLCGLASMAETALTSVSRIKVKGLAEDGDQWAIEMEKLLAEPNPAFGALLVLHSVGVIVAASVATVLAQQLSTTWGELLASVATAIVVILFCEMLAKLIAVHKPLKLARVLLGPVRALSWLLRPVTWVLGGVAALAIRLMGGRVKYPGPFVAEEESRIKVTVGEEEGELEQEETEMIRGVFEFAESTVREVMIPRIDMVTLASDVTVIDAVDLALQGGFSRIPVYEKSAGIDEIIGVLYAKDMLKQMREGHDAFPIRDLVRPAYFVPETKKLDDLLREIRQNRVHMVIVVDEYGSVAGLVTIEDLVEEIVGDIKDEYDREENLYEKVGEDEYIFDARTNIGEFNELMDADLDDTDYDTLGGFVYADLDKIPSAGDRITYDGLTFTVLATRGRRITKIRVKRNVRGRGEQGEQEPERRESVQSEEQGQKGGEKSGKVEEGEHGGSGARGEQGKQGEVAGKQGGADIRAGMSTEGR